VVDGTVARRETSVVRARGAFNVASRQSVEIGRYLARWHRSGEQVSLKLVAL